MTSPDVFVHPQALCESQDVGPGTRIWAFAHVMDGARVGAGCNIGGGAFVEAGAVVGDRVTVKNGVLIWDRVIVGNDVFLGPNMVFTNDLNPRASARKAREEFSETVVEDGASIGANATILCGLTIRASAMVGAGSVVTRDVPARAVVVGNPARQTGWVCDCGERLGPSIRCDRCQRSYRQDDRGLTLLHPEQLGQD